MISEARKQDIRMFAVKQATFAGADLSNLIVEARAIESYVRGEDDSVVLKDVALVPTQVFTLNPFGVFTAVQVCVLGEKLVDGQEYRATISETAGSNVIPLSFGGRG